MKNKLVRVGRTISLGERTFESIKFEIEGELEEGETYQEGFDKAHFDINQGFVRSGNITQTRKAEYILGDESHFPPEQVQWAKDKLKTNGDN